MHPEDAPACAAEAQPRRFLGVTLQIESHAPSNPLRTHKEKKEEEEGRGAVLPGPKNLNSQIRVNILPD